MKPPEMKVTEDEINRFIAEVAKSAKDAVKPVIENLRKKGVGNTAPEDDEPAVDKVIDLLAAELRAPLMKRNDPRLELGKKKWEDFKDHEVMRGMLSHIFDRLRDEAWKKYGHDVSGEGQKRLSVYVDDLRNGKYPEHAPAEMSALCSYVDGELKKKKLWTPEDRRQQEQSYFGLAQTVLAVTLLTKPLPGFASSGSNRLPGRG